MTRIGAYSPATARRVLSSLEELTNAPSQGNKTTTQQGSIFKTPAGGIPAGGEVLCTEQIFDPDNNNVLIDAFTSNATPNQQMIRNIFSSDIGGDRTIVVLRMYGRLCAIAEDC